MSSRLPLFELPVSGRTPETRETSAAAAAAVEDVATQRSKVLATIWAAGTDGLTDEEIQARLGLDGNSARPRRWELWQLNLIAVRKDAAGVPVRRRTHTGRAAVVWVARDGSGVR